MFIGCLNVWLIVWYEYVSIRLHQGMILFKMIVLTQYVLRQLICTWVQVGASCSIMTSDCELIMTQLLVLVKVYFKLLDMMSWSLEQVINMCEELQGEILGISMTRK